MSCAGASRLAWSVKRRKRSWCSVGPCSSASLSCWSVAGAYLCRLALFSSSSVRRGLFCRRIGAVSGGLACDRTDLRVGCGDAASLVIASL